MATTPDEARKQQVVTLKRYMEQEARRPNREMPGATEKQRGNALAASMTINLEEARERKRIEAMTTLLSGKRLRRMHSQSDRDQSCGGFYSEQSESISLHTDATFRYEKRSYSSISSGGLSLPCERKWVENGTWSVELAGVDARLVLRKEGTIFRSWKTKDGGIGVHFLDGIRWERHRM